MADERDMVKQTGGLLCSALWGHFFFNSFFFCVHHQYSCSISARETRCGWLMKASPWGRRRGRRGERLGLTNHTVPPSKIGMWSYVQIFQPELFHFNRQINYERWPNSWLKLSKGFMKGLSSCQNRHLDFPYSIKLNDLPVNTSHHIIKHWIFFENCICTVLGHEILLWHHISYI